MKITLIFCSVITLIMSCEGESHNRELTYQNITILSDMSSRLDNKPPKDLEEINQIVRYFKNECVKPGEKIGDKSCITFSAFSQKNTASIDLDKFKTLSEKQQFINSTGSFKSLGLSHEINNFERKVSEVYAKTRNSGLDLISLLIEKVENEPIVKRDTFATDGIDTTFIKYDNHIYIFTDGYLEYRDKNANSQFYFGDAEIQKVRHYCNDNHVGVTDALKKDNSLCLPACKSKESKYITLHIFETHERDKDEKLQTYRYSKGLRDNEILEAVWKKWAIDSGFKDLKWKKY